MEHKHNARPAAAAGIISEATTTTAAVAPPPSHRWAPTGLLLSTLPYGDGWPAALMDSTLSFRPRDKPAGSLLSCSSTQHLHGPSAPTTIHPGQHASTNHPGHLGEQLGELAWPSHHHLVSSKAATRLLPVGLAAASTLPPPGLLKDCPGLYLHADQWGITSSRTRPYASSSL